MALRRTKPPQSRPGRPPKFGRPARLVALTLPFDTIAVLKQINPDIARAIVTLTEKESSPIGEADARQDMLELVQLTNREALIIVNRQLVSSIVGVSLLPLDDQRAFLALNPGQGFADLEVAVQDSLDENEMEPDGRHALEEMKRRLREWRRDPARRFESRTIIVGVRLLDDAKTRRRRSKQGPQS